MAGSDNTRQQVKYTVENLGSVIKGSKKRITWTYTSGDEEHTVVFSWSKSSGKRQVTDGDYEFSDVKEGSFVFHKWQSPSGESLHILASAHTPAKGKVVDHFCKYELIINGQPFSKMQRQDGAPLPPEEGTGPWGIFDIIYPQGYDVNFTKEAPFHNKNHMQTVVLKRLSSQSIPRPESAPAAAD